jgi:hypothetical protein
MIDPSELQARYAPGEPVRPLLLALAGGLLGCLLALGLDRLLPSPVPGGMVWPALAAEAVGGDPARTGLGTAVVLLGGILGAAVFVYGQVRRFLPAPAALRGLLWGVALGLLLTPSLAARLVPWLGLTTAGGGARTVAAAALVWAELWLGLLAYGLVVGLLNPHRPVS